MPYGTSINPRKDDTAQQAAYWIVEAIERSYQSPAEQATLDELARYWKGRRRAAGKTRAWVAAALGVTADELIFFENGLLPLDQLPPDFFERLDRLLL